MLKSPRIFLCTSSDNKYREFKALIGDLPVEKINFDIEELQGDTNTVAIAKCKQAFKRFLIDFPEIENPVVIVDDTSLVFDAWKDLPGPYIKQFTNSVSNEDFHRLLAGFDVKGALATTVYGVLQKGMEEPYLAIGETHGQIVQARGPHKFGFDPNFLPDGSELTYAELGDRKSEFSHRAKALRELRAYLEKL